jgi:hypothetical protein
MFRDFRNTPEADIGLRRGIGRSGPNSEVATLHGWLGERGEKRLRFRNLGKLRRRRKAFERGGEDYEWFRYLLALPSVEEVNFWQPGDRTNFKALQAGEQFLFKLHSPRNFIVGGGVFARADILPTSLAWEAFGTSNGAKPAT